MNPRPLTAVTDIYSESLCNQIVLPPVGQTIEWNGMEWKWVEIFPSVKLQ